VSGPFSGGVYDVHVATGSGTPTNPFYLTVEFVAAS
jgi:hypothetical protein